VMIGILLKGDANQFTANGNNVQLTSFFSCLLGVSHLDLNDGDESLQCLRFLGGLPLVYQQHAILITAAFVLCALLHFLAPFPMMHMMFTMPTHQSHYGEQGG